MESINQTESRAKIYIILFIFVVYPFVLLPNPVSYFYAPKYVVLAGVALFSLYVMIREGAWVRHRAFIPLAFFAFFLLLSAILAPEPITAWVGSHFRFTGFTTYLFCFILFTLAFQIREGYGRLLGYMIGAAVLLSLSGVLQHFGINPVPHEPFRDNYGPYATLANPNFLGTYTAFILPASMLFYLHRGKRGWLLSSALIYAAMLVSVTRGVWLASFVSFILLSIYILRQEDKRKKFYRLVIALALVTLLLLPTQNGAIYKRALSIPGEMDSAVHLEKQAGSNRLLIWRESVKLIPEHWAFGIGPDHLIYEGIKTNARTVADKAHNVYLEIAVTNGLFALVAYFFFLSHFLRGWNNDEGFTFFIMVFSYLLQGFFNIDVIMVMPLFWIVLGLSLGHRCAGGKSNSPLFFVNLT